MKSMKSIVALLLAAVFALSLCACGKEAEEEAEPQMAGAYTDETTEPSEEDKAVFEAAVAGTEYADYELISLLGTQVVAGTNFKFLCKTPDGAEKVMVVYRDLDKNCSVSSVEDHE